MYMRLCSCRRFSLRYNTFSLYDQIVQALGPEPLTQGSFYIESHAQNQNRTSSILRISNDTIMISKSFQHQNVIKVVLGKQVDIGFRF